MAKGTGSELMNIGPNLSNIPLDFIMTAPLKAAVQAQQVSALAMVNFIEEMLDENGKPKTVTFTVERKKDGKGADTTITAPLLAIVPIPNLEITDVTTNFKFEISQSITKSNLREAQAKVDVKSGGLLSAWASVSLSGSVTNKKSEENVMNQGGVLEITVNARQSPTPAGLDKILQILQESMTDSDAK